MSQAIKQVTQMSGWQEILEIFEEEITSNANTSHIKEHLSPDHIKFEVMSRNKASKIVRNVLKKVQRASSIEPLKEKISYK
jgi:hypothetical protein